MYIKNILSMKLNHILLRNNKKKSNVGERILSNATLNYMSYNYAFVKFCKSYI